MTKGIKSLDRRSQRAFMQSTWRVIVPETVMVASRDTSEDGVKWHVVRPHPAGNRASRRAALKAQRTKARQRSRKNESRIAVASVRHVGSVEEVAAIRRLIRSFEEVSAMARTIGRSRDGVRSVSFSPDAGSR